MRIAVEGCAHGALETIYNTIQGIEKERNIKVDVLLCCGDFQATRNLEDLQTMAVTAKYKDMCTFYKYYSGELVAPMLTIFVGGNHEASNYLQELPYGGWVAPKIYYMGYAGVVQVNGIRIGGLSGIYKGHDYLRGHHEYSPYTEATSRSVYHVRQMEVFRLKQLSGVVDIMLSHDWPRGIYKYGNKEQLMRFKPHFREEIEDDRLGSRPAEDLLRTLKPRYWFAAHLHCKFAALVPHDGAEEPNEDLAVAHDDKDLEECDDKVFVIQPPPLGGSLTKFLALDKCLPRRRFLQILEIDAPNQTENGEIRLEYDLEWLTILNLTNHLLTTNSANYFLPGPRLGLGVDRYQFTPSQEELEKVRRLVGYDLRVPDNFCRTVTPYDPNAIVNMEPQQPNAQLNPQTTNFCDALRLDDPVQLILSNNARGGDAPSFFVEEYAAGLVVAANGEYVLNQNMGLNLPPPIYVPTPIVPNAAKKEEEELDRNSNDEEIAFSSEDDEVESEASVSDIEPEDPSSDSSQGAAEDLAAQTTAAVITVPAVQTSTKPVAPAPGTVATNIAEPTIVPPTEDESVKPPSSPATESPPLAVAVEVGEGAAATGADVEVPPLKKFKRRNVHMYAEPEEDEQADE